MDKKNSAELMDFIESSINLIETRFSMINESEDFTNTDEGLEKLDSISMRLQSIGEPIKNIVKRDPNTLYKICEKDYWSNIIKFREIISHHYIDIDTEIIYDICKNELPALKMKIIEVRKAL